MRPSEDEKLEQQLDAALLDFFRRNDSGELTDREEFLSSHLEIADQLRELLDAADLIEQMAGPRLSQLAETATSIHPDEIRRPGMQNEDDDFSLASSVDADEPTLQFFSAQPAVSQSNPPTAVVSEADPDSQATPTTRNDHSPGDVSNVSPGNTQHVLPCRFGDYVLQKILGRGGMGVVYLAHQVQLERPVAIKMIRSGCLAGQEEIVRFYAEARSAARLDHPNIVSVYQCGEIDGHHYFSMDYVPGTDLSRRINKGPLTPRDAARYVRDVSRTIAYAHSQSVLHRDLKPANVLIDQDDSVVITDFGLAKLMGTDNGLTRSGAALGTPSYMSPEQAEGNNELLAETTDVYSLGAILFAALTGKPPFQGSTAVQTIMDVIHKPAPSVRMSHPAIPLDLDTIASKCLQKTPSLRYATAQALADELDRYLKGQPIQARPLGRIYRIARWLVNVPIIAALVGVQAPDPKAGHRWTQRLLLAMFILLLPILGVAGVGMSRWWSDHTMPRHVAIAAGVPTGMYHSLADAFAKNLKETTGNRPTVYTTEGSQENLQRLLNGQVDLALLQGTSVRSGQVSVVAPMYFEAVHLLVRNGKSIAKLDDLRGHRVAVGTLDSGTHQAAAILFENSSVTFSDFDAVLIDVQEVGQDPTIDAVLAVIKVGHPSIVGLIAENEFSLLSIENAQSISLNEPTLRPFEITALDYPSAHATNIQTIATPAFLCCRSNASSRLVEESLTAMYASNEPIEGLIAAERAARWQGLPMHPAARRFFENILQNEKERKNRF
ncbi:MAG: serine/threonine-protein kinase [Pirellulaceae bacterium]|nr:serine/threonine-protein kinase [Pirellulaceae bacterium]